MGREFCLEQVARIDKLEQAVNKLERYRHWHHQDDLPPDLPIQSPETASRLGIPSGKAETLTKQPPAEQDKSHLLYPTPPCKRCEHDTDGSCEIDGCRGEGGIYYAFKPKLPAEHTKEQTRKKENLEKLLKEIYFPAEQDNIIKLKQKKCAWLNCQICYPIPPPAEQDKCVNCRYEPLEHSGLPCIKRLPLRGECGDDYPAFESKEPAKSPVEQDRCNPKNCFDNGGVCGVCIDKPKTEREIE